MFESKALVPKDDRVAVAGLPEADPKQRSLMVAALVLLLAGLGVSLYHYRGFWFPDTEEADYDQPAVSTPVTPPTQSAPLAGKLKSSAADPSPANPAPSDPRPHAGLNRKPTNGKAANGTAEKNIVVNAAAP